MSFLKSMLAFLATFAALLLLHFKLLNLPYFWDEGGYYILGAMDFYHSWSLLPKLTQPVGHTPLVMVWVGLIWHVLGYSVWAARVAIIFIAAATVVSLYDLGRRLADTEIAAWSALLLALSPVFFAQSTLVHLDLAAGLFTILAVLFFLTDRPWFFALAGSLTVMSKETAVVLLPVAWFCMWRKYGRLKARRAALLPSWAPLFVPLLPLLAWTLYYHHATGYWTGNHDYLTYNVYSTLSPIRPLWSFPRRVYELFLAGFNWLLTLSALLGVWWARKRPVIAWVPASGTDSWRELLFITAGLAGMYLLLLSVVSGAMISRYFLPVFPLFYLSAVAAVMRFPRSVARPILGAVAVCFIAAWFLNPPFPFAFEDNLAYADFIRLQERGGQYLASLPGSPRILTAWPATDELVKPILGYVPRPLRVVPARNFTMDDFTAVRSDSFDLVYLYSRNWDPPGSWMRRLPNWLKAQERYFDYRQQVDAQVLVERYHLHLLKEWDERGQWARVYSRQ